MADLVSPTGTHVSVGDDLAAKLIAAGFKEKQKPPAKKPAAKKSKPAKGSDEK